MPGHDEKAEPSRPIKQLFHASSVVFAAIAFGAAPPPGFILKS
jgi:hypothetical protein